MRLATKALLWAVLYRFALSICKFLIVIFS